MISYKKDTLMPKAPDALLGRIVRVATYAFCLCQSDADKALSSSRWRIIGINTSADHIWFRSVATGKRCSTPSLLSWFWKQVGDGTLILE